MKETIGKNEMNGKTLSVGVKTDIKNMLEQIDDDKFLFRIYISLRDYLKEKSE